MPKRSTKETSSVAAAPSKPVKLQVNTSGAWKDVSFFDAADGEKCDAVLQGSDMIARATGTRFRIVTQDADQVWLMSWGEKKGWEPR